MFVIEEIKLRKIVRTEYMKMMVESMRLSEDSHITGNRQQARAMANAAKAALKLGDKERAAQLFQAAKTLLGKTDQPAVKPSVDEQS